MLYDFSADERKNAIPRLFLVRILSYYIAGRSGVKNERIAMGRVSNIYPQKQLNQNNVKLK